MRIHNPSITGSLSISGSGLSIDGVGTFSGSSTSTGSFGSVHTAGNVGIGVTNPFERLTVESDAADSATSPSTGIVIQNANSVGIGGGAALFLKSSDNDTADRYGAKISGRRNALDNGSADLQFALEHNGSLDEVLVLTSNQKISGSVTSTGSFGQLKLIQDNSPTNPTLNFGDGNTGFYESSDNVIRVAIAGGHSYEINSGAIKGNASNRFGIQLVTPTATLPTFTPNTTDSDTGIGYSGADVLSLVAGGVSGAEITTTGVSGSSTSTGSFGKIDTANITENSSGIQIGTAGNVTDVQLMVNNKILIHQDSGGAGDSELHFDRRHDGADARIKAVAGGSGAMATELHFVTTLAGTGEQTVLQLDDNGHIYSDLANTKISGSSTSTGSFGVVHTAGHIGVGTTTPNISEGAAGSNAVTIAGSAANRNALLELKGTRSNANDFSSYIRNFSNSGATPITDIQSLRGASDTSGSLRILTSNTLAISITGSNQNVGIGTDSPDAELQIMNNDGSSYRFGYGGTSDVYLDADNVYFRTDNGGANTATLTTTGLGIGQTSPQNKLEVGTSNGTYSHFGAIAATDGHYTGISLGYREGNLNYRKTAIVQAQIADGAARGHLHFLVDTAADGGSAILADSKMMIDGTSGYVGIGTTAPFSPVQIRTASDPTSLPVASQNHLGLGGVGTSNGYVSIGFGYAGATTSYRPAIITYKNTQNGGNQAGELGFWTRNTTNGGDRPLERIRIEDGGDILFHPTGSGLKVSGSSTTSASFGSLKLVNYNEGRGASSNVFVGQQVGGGTGGDNVVLGTAAGENLTTGNSNVYVGSAAGKTSTDVDKAVFVGFEAGKEGNITSDADGIIGIGYRSAMNITTGRYNTAIGYEALYTATELDSNTAIGYQALKAMSGSAGDVGNTAVGYHAGTAVTTDKHNTFVGRTAGAQTTNGSTENTFVGYFAGYSNKSGSSNTFIGAHSGYSYSNASNPRNVFVGAYSGYNQVNSAYNVYLGYSAGHGSSGATAHFNIGIGYQALKDIASGNHNIAIGYQAGDNLETGHSNIIIGNSALTTDQDGTTSVIIGHEAGGTLTGTTDNVFIGYQSGYNLDGTADNLAGVVAIGMEAFEGHGDTTSDASNTVAIGRQALKTLKTGQYNVAVGYQAMLVETQGDRSTAVGYQALKDQNGVNGEVHNTAVGYIAGHNITTGKSNTVLGSEAGTSLTTASQSVCIGRTAGNTISTGNQNIAVGYGAMNNNTVTGDDNIAIGTNAGNDLTSGRLNIFMGKNAGGAITDGNGVIVIGHDAVTGDADSDIVAIGNHALQDAQAGATANTAVGHQAGTDLTTGDDNVFMGTNAARENRTGGQNVYLGSGAGQGTNAYSNSSNIGVGYRALYLNRTGTENVAIGKESMRDATTSDGSVAVGAESLYNVTSGNNNVAVGKQALYYILTGAGNVAVGLKALKDNTANNNVAVGTSALENNVGGTGNVAMGYEALLTETDLDQNTAIGHEALKVMSGSAGDSKNTAVGYQAGLTMTTGTQNTLVGTSTGDAITTGAYNTAIGTSALSSLTTGNNNVVVGRAAASGLGSSESGNTVIGTAAMQAMDADNETVDNNIAIGLNALYGGDLSGTSNDYEHNVVIGKDAMDGSGTVGGSRNIFIGGNSGGGSWTTAASNYNTAIGYNTMPAAMNGAEGNTTVGYFSMLSLTTGDSNTAVGRNSGYTLATGVRNTFLGNSAGYTTVDVDKTVCIGYNAAANGNMTSAADGTIAIGNSSLLELTTGAGNTVIGFEALSTATGSNYNTAIGYQALKVQTPYQASSTESGLNTAVGYQAGVAVTFGHENTLMGYKAGAAITTGYQNVAIGNTALDALTVGRVNVAVGHGALGGEDVGTGTIAIGYLAAHRQNSDSDHEQTKNTIIGYEAGYYNVTGTSNILIGWRAGLGVDGNSYSTNIGVGDRALTAITTGNLNTAIGHESGMAITTGNHNAFFGQNAGQDATTASGSVFIGSQAGVTTTTGNMNVAVGYDALSGGVTTGDYNIAIGMSAGDAITSGFSNILLGRDAGGALQSGYNHILMGPTAGDALTGGRNNVALGQHALGGSTANVGCIAIGSAAMQAINSTDADHTVGVGNEVLVSLTDGQKNVAIGHQALDAVTTGNENTAVGYQALSAQQTDRNGATAVGSLALYQNAPAATTDYSAAFGQEAGSNQTSGYQNTFLGGQTSGNGADAINQIVIGYHAAGTGDNYAVIGNDAIQRVYAGDDTGAVLYAGSATVQTSDRRIKEKIESIDLGLDFINKLKPVQYEKRQPIDYDDSLKENLRWYKENESPRVLDDSEKSKQRVGFIAQEVGDVLKDLGFDSNNDMVDVDEVTTQQHIAYSKLVAPMVKAIQELSEQNKNLEERLKELENKLQ